MLNILSYSSSLNRRERYSKIKATYWEVEDLNGPDLRYLFWLKEPATFGVNDDTVVIPIEEEESSTGGEEVKYEYTLVRDLGWNYGEHFPVRDGLNPNKVLPEFPQTGLSQYSLWGEEDNIRVLPSEFGDAGGTISMQYNVKESQWEVVIEPPSEKIGVNETFSVSLVGAVPALVIVGYAYKYTKKEITAYTEHYGLVDNTLEVELTSASGKEQAMNALRRLVEKYNTVQPEYEFEYITHNDSPRTTDLFVDHNYVIPQSISMEIGEGYSRRTVSSAFAYNELDSLLEYRADRSKVRLDDFEISDKTLNEVQYNLRSFIY